MDSDFSSLTGMWTNKLNVLFIVNNVSKIGHGLNNLVILLHLFLLYFQRHIQYITYVYCFM